MKIAFRKIVPALSIVFAGIATGAHASENKAAASEPQPIQLAQAQVDASRISCPTDSNDRTKANSTDRTKEQTQFEIFLKELSRESGN